MDEITQKKKKIYTQPVLKSLGKLSLITQGQTAVAFDIHTPGNVYATISAIP